MNITEKYHYFQSGGETCRYGIYGLSREYFHSDTIAEEPPEKIIELQPPEAKIKVMQLVITGRCNLNCVYCSFKANSPQYVDKDMDSWIIEAACKRFNEIAGEKGLVLITGGEPELYPQAVDYIAENCISKKLIFTNGTIITRDRIQKLHNAGVDIVFSLDGDLLAQNAMRKGAGGSFSKVVNALNYCRELNIEFGISAVAGDHNIERLAELTEYIHREFAPASMGLNLPHFYQGEPWMRIEDYTEQLIKIFQFAKQEGFFIDQIARRMEPLITQKFRYRDCSSQGEKIVVFPNGVICSCVNEMALKDAKVDWETRIPLNFKQCEDCYAIGICGGGCAFDGETIYGNGCFDERNCYFTRKMLEFLIWEFRKELGENAIDREKLASIYGGMYIRGAGTRMSIGHSTQ